MNSKLFSVNRICKLCKISKNTFYNHKHQDDLFQEKYNRLKSKIKKIIKNNNSYGIKRIKSALLKDYNEHIGRDALARLLKLWRLGLNRKIKKRKFSVIQKILILLSSKVNILIRTDIAKPLQAVSSDITEIWYNNGKNKAYLAVHKDVFGQMVYGWDLDEKMETKLVLNSFKKAKDNIKILNRKILKNIIFHQDQGSQYTSYRYTDIILKNKMRLSYSTPGTPTENPGQESFFGRLKDECQDDFHEIKDIKKLKKFIKKRMNYYNNKRLHTSLKNQTPKEFTKLFIKKIH